ncbi:MAG: hypothetical protein RL846_46335 [Deltaproteobacteria bacterium]
MRTVGVGPQYGGPTAPRFPVQVHPARGPWEAIHGNFKHFSQEGQLLVLSAGPEPSQDFLGRRKYPRNALRADLFFRDQQDVVMDNNAPFPFADGSMSGVYLGKGICNCSGSAQTCGGLPDDRRGIEHLAKEVMRVVDWSRDDARVVLTGGVHLRRGPDAVRADWARVLSRIETEYPVRALLVDLHPEGGFGGVVIERAPKEETAPRPRRVAQRAPHLSQMPSRMPFGGMFGQGRGRDIGWG